MACETLTAQEGSGSLFTMMSAILKPYGILKEYTGGQSEVPIEPGQTVRQALAGWGIPPEVVALVVINDQQASKDSLVEEGDVVKILAVVGGG